MKESAKKEWLFTLTMIAIVACIYYSIPLIKISVGTKLLLAFIFVLLLVLVVGGIIAATAKKTEKKDDKETEKKPESLLDQVKGFIVDVPENHIWVLRNVWGSDPEKRPYLGYQAKEEGLRIFIPKVWHDEVKLVSLVPLQRDPELVEVNTKDNILPLIDYRTKTWIAQNKIGNHEKIDFAAIKYALRVKNRAELEDQWIQVVLNGATAGYFCSKPKDSDDPKDIGLTEMNKEQLNNLAKDVTNAFNDEMKHFGIQGEISIHNIRPPKAIEAASSQVVVAKLREEASGHEAAAMKKIKDETGADGKWIVIAEAISNLARSLIGASEQKPFSSKSKEEKHE